MNNIYYHENSRIVLGIPEILENQINSFSKTNTPLGNLLFYFLENAIEQMEDEALSQQMHCIMDAISLAIEKDILKESLPLINALVGLYRENYVPADDLLKGMS